MEIHASWTDLQHACCKFICMYTQKTTCISSYKTSASKVRNVTIHKFCAMANNINPMSVNMEATFAAQQIQVVIITVHLHAVTPFACQGGTL